MKRILIPLSLWDTTDKVIAQGLRIAEAFQSTIWLLHVVKIPSHVSRWPEELRRQREIELATLQRELDLRARDISSKGLEVHSVVMESSGAVVAILEQAELLNIDLIVMGSHSRGAILGAIIGDVTRDVLRSAPCPVLVVPMTAHTIDDSNQTFDKV